jgi:Kef-type K+ transport system membrane component KefB
MLDYELSRLILSILLLLIAAICIGHIFTAIYFPRVIGEICAGIILGPSIFGAYDSDLYNFIFNGFIEQSKVLSIFYWLGLILIMFSAGFDMPTRKDGESKKLYILLFLGGIIPPFICGLILSLFIPNTIESNPNTFSLTVGVSAAVTSIPVLSRIFIDLKMSESSFAKIVLTVSAAQGLFLWIILSIALEIQSEVISNINFIQGHIEYIILTVLFVIIIIYFLPIILNYVWNIFVNEMHKSSLIGYMLIICLSIVSISSFFKVNVVLSALMAGLSISRFKGIDMLNAKNNIRNFSIWFFIPLYFSLVGFKLDVNIDQFNFLLLLKILTVTSFVKCFSVAICAKLANISWSRGLDYGLAMNARGGPGIVIASIAYEANIFDNELFLIFVIISIITSLLAGLWLRYRIKFLTNFR